MFQLCCHISASRNVRVKFFRLCSLFLVKSLSLLTMVTGNLYSFFSWFSWAATKVTAVILALNENHSNQVSREALCSAALSGITCCGVSQMQKSKSSVLSVQNYQRFLHCHWTLISVFALQLVQAWLPALLWQSTGLEGFNTFCSSTWGAVLNTYLHL